jgi:hypothetical protein
MIDDPHFHFQLFLYLFTFVAAVGLGLLFVKQKGVADAADNAADLPLTYQDGARVELVGLRKASLNGATGHVVKELDAGTGRIAVKLISGREVAVKPENLKVADLELILDNPHHVEKNYNEAVAVAVEACAEDTKGQMCYICMDGADKEGLVRGCACRGGNGFVHVSCLARQAKILVAEAEEKNLGTSTRRC